MTFSCLLMIFVPLLLFFFGRDVVVLKPVGGVLSCSVLSANFRFAEKIESDV